MLVLIGEAFLFLLIPVEFIIELLIFKTRNLKNIFPLESLKRRGGLNGKSGRGNDLLHWKNSTHNNFILQFFTHAADNSA